MFKTLDFFRVHAGSYLIAYAFTFIGCIWLTIVFSYRGDFKLSNFQDGVLSSAFMVGLLVASPIFAFLAKR